MGQSPARLVAGVLAPDTGRVFGNKGTLAVWCNPIIAGRWRRFVFLWSLFEVYMRHLIVCCGLLLAILPSAAAQSRFSDTDFEQGSVSGNVYTNPALGITWEFPKDWVTVSKGVSELGDDYHVILRLARAGIQSSDLVEFDYSTSTDSTKLNSTLANEGWEPSGNPRFYTLGGGMPAQ